MTFTDDPTGHQRAPARETAVSTAETDPAAIDLDDLIKALARAAGMYSAPGAAALLHGVIVVVKALQERVADLEAANVELAGALMDAGVTPTFDEDGGHEGFMCCECGRQHDTSETIQHDKDCCTGVALARLPADALKRAKAKEELVTAARNGLDDARNEIVTLSTVNNSAWHWMLGIDNALVKLPALPEDGT
jgi:hypothetical protein